MNWKFYGFEYTLKFYALAKYSYLICSYPCNLYVIGLYANINKNTLGW